MTASTPPEAPAAATGPTTDPRTNSPTYPSGSWSRHRSLLGHPREPRGRRRHRATPADTPHLPVPVGVPPSLRVHKRRHHCVGPHPRPRPTHLAIADAGSPPRSVLPFPECRTAAEHRGAPCSTGPTKARPRVLAVSVSLSANGRRRCDPWRCDPWSFALSVISLCWADLYRSRRRLRRRAVLRCAAGAPSSGRSVAVGVRAALGLEIPRSGPLCPPPARSS